MINLRYLNIHEKNYCSCNFGIKLPFSVFPRLYRLLLVGSPYRFDFSLFNMLALVGNDLKLPYTLASLDNMLINMSD